MRPARALVSAVLLLLVLTAGCGSPETGVTETETSSTTSTAAPGAPATAATTATTTAPVTTAVKPPCVLSIAQEGRVTDAAGLLEREPEHEQFTELLAEIFGVEIAVVLVADSGDCTPLEVAAEIAGTWTLGDAEQSPTFVMVVDNGEGRVVIEAGPGVRMTRERLKAVSGAGHEGFAAGDFDSGIETIMVALKMLNDQIADRPQLDADRTVLLDDGTGTDHLQLVGTAQDSDGSVSLTRKQEGLLQAGAVWFADEVPVIDGFETQFVFEIDHISWYTIGDGFAFVIQDHGHRALGEAASGNGYQGIPSSVAVEFDTVFHDYMNDPVYPVPGDSPPALLANHLAVHSRGTEPNWSSGHSMLGSVGLQDVRLYDRRHHRATIRYLPGLLSVFLDGSDTPFLDMELYLDELLDLDDGAAYIGFTAGTESGLYSDFLIHSWAHDACEATGCE